MESLKRSWASLIVVALIAFGTVLLWRATAPPDPNSRYYYHIGPDGSPILRLDKTTGLIDHSEHGKWEEGWN